MTDALLPLLLLWSCSRGKGSAPAAVWPTAASPPPPPPPPLPPPPPPPAADANTGTPMEEFLKQTPAQRVVDVRDTLTNLLSPKPKPKPKPKPSKRKAAAPAAPKAAASKLPAFLSFSPEMDVSVADVQKVLIARGVKIARDGVYGPKTQNAWRALASKVKLSPTIERLSPKIARVATKTFNTLSEPVLAIP